MGEERLFYALDYKKKTPSQVIHQNLYLHSSQVFWAFEWYGACQDVITLPAPWQNPPVNVSYARKLSSYCGDVVTAKL